MTNPILAIKDLRFAYSKQSEELFGGLTRDFPRGELTAVTGPSGQGKSTLLYVLGLLLTPNQGEVLFDGHDMSRSRDGARSAIRASRIGFVFQDAELDPSRKMIDSVLEPALYAGHSRKRRLGRAKELLAQFGLEHRADHRPGQVSGGQAQRLSVCRALLNEPDVILADEPTGNLDRGNAQLVLRALQLAAHSHGNTVIIASHDPFVLEHADEVLAL